ncbi:GNAT family N-acetyltransferase [Nonomuraea sp. NPDC048916]|uniref:GNAT family N-acetyltransferase n=1 Tax=Nonomuraea sp. NPDC048916 TaxID=3154232 RepID=UPI0034067302
MSHRHLLSGRDDARAHGRVDAIIVPTVRPAAYLRNAARVALRLGCPLVALCSGRWASADLAVRGLDDLGVELVAADLPRHARPRPSLTTSALLRGNPVDRRADTGPKRNLGLMLAKLAGWERVVFLDDDIVVPDPEDLLRAAGLLDTYDRVALSVKWFHDNSVICHSNRDTGEEQATFVGAGAMAVAANRAPAFFPAVYNEDWLDLLGDTRLRPTAVVGTVVQRPYDPYLSPDRARTEEFGDILAEGLYALLDAGEAWTGADRDFWGHHIDRRRRLIGDILRRIRQGAGGDRHRRDRMRASLRAALAQHEFVTPKLCVRYLRAWQADRDDWQTFLSDLPTDLPLEKARDELAGRGPLGTRVVHHTPEPPRGAKRPVQRDTVLPITPWAVCDPLTDAGYVSIRPLQEGDLNALTAALGQERYFARALARQRAGHGTLLVVWADTTPVGDVYIWRDQAEEKVLRRRLKGTPLLTHMELAERYRNKGLGTVLMHAAEQLLLRYGHSSVALGVGMDNDSALHLYRRVGFSTWRRSPIQTTEEILHEDGTSERRPEKCRILCTSISPFPSELR